MKISIVTVYNSLNYGSYWQAYALCEVLRQRNGEVSFVNTKARNPFMQTLRSVIRKLLALQFAETWFHVLKYVSFWRDNRKFSICKNKDLNKQEIFVFGSDEIWNISRREFSDFPVFFGVGIPDAYLVSYAVSINTTRLEQVKESKLLKTAVERFNRIGVRDSYTLETLKAVTTRKISLVLDPTFLMVKSFYDNPEEKCLDKNYILVYSYGPHMEQKKIDKIMSFAKSKKLKLVSVGFYLNWCDDNVPASPTLFLSYVKNASFIVTDTFHGTVFSIIYNKKFVTYGDFKRKIHEVLNQFELQSRNVGSDTVLENIMEDHINYDKVNILIENFRKESFKYIDHFIMNATGASCEGDL